jgi:hypothetical protein
MVSSALLQPLAAVQVGNRQHKKTDGQHGENHISHRILLFVPCESIGSANAAEIIRAQQAKTKTSLLVTLASFRRVSVGPKRL